MRGEIKYLCHLERAVFVNVVHIWIITIKNEAIIIHLQSFLFGYLPAIVSKLPGRICPHPHGFDIAYFSIATPRLYEMKHRSQRRESTDQFANLNMN